MYGESYKMLRWSWLFFFILLGICYNHFITPSFQLGSWGCNPLSTVCWRLYCEELGGSVCCVGREKKRVIACIGCTCVHIKGSKKRKDKLSFKKKDVHFSLRLFFFCSSPRFIGTTGGPPQYKKLARQAYMALRGQDIHFKVPLKKRRDKGYVLEQLSAAKDESLFSIFIFHPSFLSFFPGGLYIIYPAQYKNERKRKRFFSQ